ncbi:ribonuclease domain-containing protein [Stenotrophomonas sp. VV52]|uniref:RHS repeat-associated core domain-containing protein n=1 Tax=Stenotrophomonas sp. VV52 TaxID=2066958 RepID=UPI0011AFA473|nr:ribonuclease domain-containing protein [Stenotrophomonas sp. VV52]
MASMAGASNAPTTHYRYDAEHLLVCTSTPATSVWQYWLGGVVVNATGEGHELSWPYCGGQRVATKRSGIGGGPIATLLATDAAGSVLMEADFGVRSQGYTPHGYLASDRTELQPAYNGELLDNSSGCYLLGAGNHRPYSPTLQYFLAPDPFSPFDEGGLNAYAYCAGDPINRTDPSGHFWKWIVAGLSVVAAVASLGALAVPLVAGSAALTASAVAGLGLSALGAVAEVGALVADATGDEEAGRILGWVGLGISAVGMVAAAPAIAKAGTKLFKGLGRSLRSASRSAESMPLVPFSRSTQEVTYTRSYIATNTLEAPPRRYAAPARAPAAPRARAAPRPVRAAQVAPPDAKPMRSMAFEDLENEERRMLLYAVHRNSNKFKHGRKDGSTFYNGEGKLPIKREKHYREYTVDDYKFETRGTRRIILGGLKRHGPQQVYATDDHYETFIEIRKPKFWPRR